MYVSKNHLGQLESRATKPIMSVECLKLATSMLIETYKEEPAWQRPPDPPYTFYWDILYHACQLVKPASLSDLNWCTVGSSAVPLLAQVFSVYSRVYGTRSLVGEEQALSACKDENMKRYFQWIQSIQQFIREWQNKIAENDCTMKELLDYASAEISLSKIAQSVLVEATINVEDTVQLKTRMNHLCDGVRGLLIKKWQDNERCGSIVCTCTYYICTYVLYILHALTIIIVFVSVFSACVYKSMLNLLHTMPIVLFICTYVRTVLYIYYVCTLLYICMCMVVYTMYAVITIVFSCAYNHMHTVLVLFSSLHHLRSLVLNM